LSSFRVSSSVSQFLETAAVLTKERPVRSRPKLTLRVPRWKFFLAWWHEETGDNLKFKKWSQETQKAVEIESK
jgi:hypothetical protein